MTDGKGRLSGKVALVTGGTRGIGFGIVRAFLEAGADVAFSGVSAERVAAAKGALATERVEAVVADLTDSAASAALVRRTLDRFSRLDVLVNNAGTGSTLDPWQLTPEEWDRVQAVNLRAVFFVSRDAARIMRDRGGGSIVNIASFAGQTGGLAGSPAYAAAKAGVIGLTRSLARRFAPHKIRVNAISPADIETDMTAGWPKELKERLIAITPLGRFGAVEEVVGAALYFASDESSYTTGQTLNINGGAYMG